MIYPIGSWVVVTRPYGMVDHSGQVAQVRSYDVRRGEEVNSATFIRIRFPGDQFFQGATVPPWDLRPATRADLRAGAIELIKQGRNTPYRDSKTKMREDARQLLAAARRLPAEGHYNAS